MEKKTRFETRMPLVERSGCVHGANVLARDVYNLRPRRHFGRDAGLELVGAPLCVSSLRGYRALCRLDYKGRASVLCARGTDIALMPADVGVGAPAMSGGALPGEAYCAAATDAVTALVMTSEGPVEVSTASEPVTVRALESDFPAVGLRAVGAGVLSVEGGGRRLSRVYGGAERLDSRDADAVYKDLTEAYATLCSRAGAAGEMIQPALVRYRLRDSRGGLLHTSAPVVAALPGGAQCTSAIGLGSSDRQTLEGFTLQASTWRLEATFYEAEGPRAADVAVCEVYMSPLFHPRLATVARAPLATGRAGSASAAFITASLPGVEYALGGDSPAVTRRLLERAFARMDEIEECVAVIERPFGDSVRTLAIACSPACDPAAVGEALHKALERSVKRHTRAEALLRAPHRFTARCTAAGASTRVWGDITVRRARPWSAASCAASTAAGYWQGVTRVVFADGSVVTRSETHGGGVPVTLSPLLSYPTPDAVEMSVTVSAGGVIKHATVPLRPDGSGLASVYTGDSAVPLALVAGSPAATGGEEVSFSFADVLLFAPSESPLMPDAMTALGSTPLAVMASERGQQSWEFGRSHFTVASRAGMFSVASGEGRRKLSVRRLSSISPGRPDAWRATPEGTYILAEGCLYLLDGRGRCRFFDESAAVALAYNSASEELWAIGPGAGATVYCLGDGGRKYRRDCCNAASVAQVGAEEYAQASDGLYALCRENRDMPRDIALGLEIIPPGSDPVRVSALELHMRAQGVACEVSAVSDEPGGSAGFTLSRHSLAGMALGPVSLPVAARAVRRIILTLEGSAGAGFVFDRFKITYMPWTNYLTPLKCC